MPTLTPAQPAYCQIIDAYQEAFASLGERLDYTLRNEHAELIGNNVKTFVNKLYGNRHFREEEACILLDMLGLPEKAAAIRTYMAMRQNVPHFLLTSGIGVAYIYSLTDIPMHSFRRRMKTPELWQPDELTTFFTRLDAFSQQLRDQLNPTGTGA